MPLPNSRRRIVALLVAGGCLASPPSAAIASHYGGDPDDYHAAFVRKSDDRTLESGQEATSWLEARNISNSVTWDNTVVKLGADEPHDRSSPMYWDQDWLSPSRPTFMDQRTVGPNQVGRFTFRVKAPTVNARTVYREFLAPVAEGVAWMDAAEWGDRTVDYTITPPSPPSVSLTNVPVRIRRGDPLRAEARARDDYTMAGVRMSVGGAEADATVPNPEAPDTYVGELPTGHLPAGFHTLSVTGTDHVGNQATVTHQFEVFEPPPPQAVPPPQLDASVALRGRVLRRGRGIRATSLRVRAPTGSRISVSCRPRRRCPNLVVGSTKTGTTFLRGMRGRRLRRGTQVYVKVTKPGMTGELTLLTIGRRNVVSNQYPMPGQ